MKIFVSFVLILAVLSCSSKVEKEPQSASTYRQARSSSISTTKDTDTKDTDITKDIIKTLVVEKGKETTDLFVLAITSESDLTLCYRLEELRNDYFDYCVDLLGSDFEKRLTDPYTIPSIKSAAIYAVHFLEMFDKHVDKCLQSSTLSK